MYSVKLLQHFQDPHYAGKVPEANVTVQAENPVCGDMLELQARVIKGRIETIRFRANGCVPSMACGSALCKLSEGRSLEQVIGISSRDLLDEVGGVPQASAHAVQLALDALKRLVRSSS